MQVSGTLRKRRRRCLAKVCLSQNDFADLPSSSKSIRSSSHTIIHVPSSENVNPARTTQPKYKRVTRNPNLHAIDIEKPKDIFIIKNRNHTLPTHQSNYRDNPSVHESLKNRSHFLDPSTMSRLRQVLLLGMTTGAYPWVWSAKEYRIDKWSPFLEKIWYYQSYPWFIQTVCLTCYQFYAFYNLFTNGDGQQNRKLFMGSFSVVWYLSCLYLAINLYYHMDETRQYINTLLKFNKEQVDKYLIHLDGYKDKGKLTINGAIPSTILQVFVSVLVFVLMPFQNWFLFSYIYPKPWYWLIPGAIHQYILYGYVIASYSLLAWMVAAHANSVNFWLMEMHQNNDSGYTRDILRDPKIAMEKYRALQVLCAAFNQCMAPMAVIVVKLIIAGALIPCSYVIIRSMNHLFFDEFPQILSYPLGIMDCATVGFTVLTMAAEMYDLSAGFTHSWSKTEQKDRRRLLMSFPCLSIRVRSFYVITVSTTITFFHHLVGFIIHCIISFP